MACRQQDGLAATQPSAAVAGGLRLPRSEGGWKAMLAAGVTELRKPFGKLSAAERAAVAAEMRFCSACRGRFGEDLHVARWTDALADEVGGQKPLDAPKWPRGKQREARCLGARDAKGSWPLWSLCRVRRTAPSSKTHCSIGRWRLRRGQCRAYERDSSPRKRRA